MHTLTSGSRTPSRPRRKALIGALAATALLVGAIQAMAPASAAAMMSDDTPDGCRDQGGTWIGGDEGWCFHNPFGEGAGGGSSSGGSSSGGGSHPATAPPSVPDTRGCERVTAGWICPPSSGPEIVFYNESGRLDEDPYGIAKAFEDALQRSKHGDRSRGEGHGKRARKSRSRARH